MIDRKAFAGMRAEMKAHEARREQVIALSRDIIRASKQIIYAVHRGDMAKAKKEIALTTKDRQKLASLGSGIDTDIDGTALQEYVEALCYYSFVAEKKILTASSLGVDTTSYLLGLCDLTGELARRAVNAVIRKEFSELSLVHKAVEGIYGEFLQFDLRNGELRKKSDAIKWNLKKIEEVLYDVRVKGMC